MNIRNLDLRSCIEKWESSKGDPDPVSNSEKTETEKEIVRRIDRFLEDNADLKEGSLDDKLGLELYTEILSFNSGFTIREAGDLGVWRRLSVDLYPEVVRKRWPVVNSEKLREEYFWKGITRIWFRSLWWYTHLSWQGDRNKTSQVLSCATTDTKLGIVERPGPRGFRVDLSREIMSRLPQLNPGTTLGSEKFRALMKLNTAKLRVIEPGFCLGGVKGYVDGLLSDLGFETDV